MSQPRSKKLRRAAPAPPSRARVSPVSQTAEYALRAMSCLAAQPSGTALTALALSDAACVPAHYLSKILRKLVEAGLLSSQKGHGGGFVLARAPTRVRLADILAAVDELPTGGRCAFGWGNCDARHPCPLHDAWSRLNIAFCEWAEGTTLAEVAGTRRARETG